MLFELAHHVGDGRLLLADGDVHALNAGRLLIDDGVDGHGGLAGLAVTDDQFALTAADRHHGVDGLVAGLYRLADALAIDNARRHALDGRGGLGIERALAVDGVAQRVDDAAQQFRTHRHFEDATGGAHRVAFADAFVLAQHHSADRVLLEVQCQAEDVAGELEHFAVARIGQAVDAHDAVGHRHDTADVAVFSRAGEVFDPLTDQVADFRCLDRHVLESS